MGSIPGSGRSPGEGNGSLFAVFLPENPRDRGAWRATIQRVAKSQTELNNRAHTHRPMEDGRRFHHATQNGLQFKTYELFLEFSI